MSDKRKFNYAFLIMISLIAVFLSYSPVAQAQNWFAMPPYNTLWPLWSPALSPIDSATGLPVPIVNELLPSTVLPVQPGLTWDPSAANPWLLYNTPLGMAYYDPVGGVNLWPPSYLRDSLGAPLPLTLPLDYGFLPPTPSSWITTTVPQANIAAYFYLMGIPAPIFAPTTVSPTFVAPTATPIFGPTATPVIGPTATPVFFGPTLFTPTIAGVPLFLGASALLPIAPPAVAPLPVPTAITPLPVPTAILPPVTTLALPPVTTLALPPVTTLALPPVTTAVPALISGLLIP